MFRLSLPGLLQRALRRRSESSQQRYTARIVAEHEKQCRKCGS